MDEIRARPQTAALVPLPSPSSADCLMARRRREAR